MASRDLEALLLRRDIVTVEQVRQAGAVTRGTSASWLEYLLLSKQLDEETLARCTSAEVGVPRCDLDRLAQVPGDVLACLPGDLAAEHRMVPLWLEPDGDLCVGMVDPCDQAAVLEVEFFLGRHLLREVAPATPLAWALSTYYGARSALWPRPRPRLARGSRAPIAAEPAPADLARDLETTEYEARVIGRGLGSAGMLVLVDDEIRGPDARVGPRLRPDRAAQRS